MEESTSKEKILKNVRKALIHKSEQDFSLVDMDADIYPEPSQDLEFEFAKEFTSLNGKFHFCEDESVVGEVLKELITENGWKNICCFDNTLHQKLVALGLPTSNQIDSLPGVDIGITGCEFLIARTGSVMVSSKMASGRKLPFYANYHVVIAYTNQLVYAVKDALKAMKTRYGNSWPSMITVITGPSRTADIEKTLVQGAHGPKEIFVLLVDQ